MMWTRLAAYAAVLGIGVSLPAVAQELRAVGDTGWLGTGRSYEMEPGHYFWVGELSGTFFSDEGEGGMFHHADVKCPGWLDIDVTENMTQGGGSCIVAEPEGDRAYLNWHISGQPDREGKVPGTFQYTGGTGKYSEISGINKFVGVTRINWMDGTATGYALWNR